MSGRGPAARSVVLTPGITGSDGIAELSRLVVRALAPRVEVISLTDPPGFTMNADDFPGVRSFGAQGRRFRFVAAAVRAGLRGGSAAQIICLHLHLSPLTPLLGGRSSVVLVGIEAWRSLQWMERAALRRAQTVMAISAHTMKRFREANPDFSDRPIRICHLAVREKDVAPLSTEREASCPRPFALIVGRLSAEERYKGHDLLIDLWPSVMAHVPGARLVIVGDGDDRARLQARAAPMGDHVSFRGRVPDDVLARLYRDCAFFVMPSLDEGFGLVFLEAMHAGKPCIGGAGAAAEVIVDGVTGFVVEQDREQVLRAMQRLFRDGELRRRMGEAGAARVAAEFMEAHFRRRFHALLDRMMPEQPRWS